MRGEGEPGNEATQPLHNRESGVKNVSLRFPANDRHSSGTCGAVREVGN